MTSYSAAFHIVSKLQSHGHIAYFAGGWVRDHLLGLDSDDIDIATSADVEQIQSLFSKTIPVGISFGIVIVVENSHQFEVATFRKDIEYVDGRRPSKIIKATPEEDALRRDFTINGMFYNPITEEVLDYVGGKKDLEARLIRAIGNAEDRFREDRLRMMRAVRYSARFRFEIEESTHRAIALHAHMLYPSVAKERVMNEFEKMSKNIGIETAFSLLFSTGLLATIFPQIAHYSKEEFSILTRYIAHFPPRLPPLVYILELFSAFTLTEKLLLQDEYKLSRKDGELIVYHHELTHAIGKKLTPYEAAKLYAHPLFELLFPTCIVKISEAERAEVILYHEKAKETLSREIECFKSRSFPLKAQHLIEKGIPQGPLLGKLLEEGNKTAINRGIFDPVILTELCIRDLLPLFKSSNE